MKSKLVLPATLVAIMVLALSPPAQGNGDAILAVDPQTINVTVCSTFTVDIRIENLPRVMRHFLIHVTFDPDAMSVEDYSFIELFDSRSWTPGIAIDSDGGYIGLQGNGGPWDEDATWMNVTFHCKGAGTSTIGFRTDSWLHDGTSEIPIDFENSREGTVTQRAPRPAPRYSDAVGGVLTSSNKLAVLAPYLILIGLVAAVTTVTIIVKRRRKA